MRSLSGILSNLSNIYKNRGEEDKAIELLNEAIDVLEARETSMTRKQRCNQNNQEVYLTYN